MTGESIEQAIQEDARRALRTLTRWVVDHARSFVSRWVVGLILTAAASVVIGAISLPVLAVVLGGVVLVAAAAGCAYLNRFLYRERSARRVAWVQGKRMQQGC
jgi:hypothetical protein